MGLQLASTLSLGVHTIHARAEPATRPWLPSIGELREFVALVDECGFESIWAGDHISFSASLLDPLLQLAQAAIVSRRLLLGTGVYLLPLRHPVPVAKQVSSLDHLTEGRLIFGVGIGGEFPKEYEACGVPREERGARLTEAITLLRKLWTGEPVTYRGRFHAHFDEVSLHPPARQPGGPPIWCGGRQPVALQRAGELADGWLSYAITPEMFRDGLARIEAAAAGAGRDGACFATGHHLFVCLDESREAALATAVAVLSQRYGIDFRKATERYAALGQPEAVATAIRAFHDAGVRHIVVDIVSAHADRPSQIAWFARDVMPRLADLRAPPG